MRILLWHGWLLEGSGSNIYTARVAELLAAEGHDVLLLCQEPHPERYPWIEACGTVDARGVTALMPNGEHRGPGRCVLLRPAIGGLLPVFVVDEYEGFRVKTFLDLSDDELSHYLDRNVVALRAAEAYHRSEAVITGHAVPGAGIGARALGPGRFVAKVHGSDVEYAIRLQDRYRELAREGLRAARVVAGASAEVLERIVELVGDVGEMRAIAPGVDAAAFHPRPRREALLETAERLQADPETAAGRPASLDREVAHALARCDAHALEDLAHGYDQEVPDPEAADRLRALAEHTGPIVGYFGKLIPQKGVELLLAAARRSEHAPNVLVAGFGLHREWLTAIHQALSEGDRDALAWLRDAGRLPADLEVDGADPPVTFTGRLDHRYAPGVLAAMDVLVVPSILTEAFGMVAAEGAAAGALPLVARHSGLAEVASALEGTVDRPGLFSFEPGPGSVGRIAGGIDRLLSLGPGEREELQAGIRGFISIEWSWRRTAARLLEAAGPPPAA